MRRPRPATRMRHMLQMAFTNFNFWLSSTATRGLIQVECSLNDQKMRSRKSEAPGSPRTQIQAWYAPSIVRLGVATVLEVF
jgi:hypothetical protein